MKNRLYLCIDLKSFYASVECSVLGLDPMTTNLVVADASRTDKTICLAVSPSMKSLGIPGRPRLFEVIQGVKKINDERKKKAPEGGFTAKSVNYTELAENPALELDFLIAPPQMAYYMKFSSDIYHIYLKYVSPEDVHVYSIDEVFIDVTRYTGGDKAAAHRLAMRMINDVLAATGITATAGIGTNMYLAKIAMDIMAKRMKPDKNGVRIAFLDEDAYRRELWTYRPLTDFWRVGEGYAKRLEANGIYTMGDIAERSLTEYGEAKLYKLFGVNAELLIDHAWGWEPCGIEHIRQYIPENKSICSGQVLQCPYSFEQTRLIVMEMTELMALDLVEKRLVTDQLVLTVGYDTENLTGGNVSYKGAVTTDRYGRKIPKHAHGTANTGQFTSSTSLILKSVTELFDRIVDPGLLVRRVSLSANHVIPEEKAEHKRAFEQLELFSDYDGVCAEREREEEKRKRERAIQETTIKLKNRFGKNAILKGMNLKEGATTIKRNGQIGGHKA